MAQKAHPVHFSVLAAVAGLKPLWLMTKASIEIIFRGHTDTHKAHPLHLSFRKVNLTVTIPPQNKSF